jgi:thiol-disulfide isomerase/thioredoxin
VWKKGFSASFIFIVACLALWFAFGRRLTPDKLPTPVDNLDQLENVGAPDFELPDFEGRKHRLSEFKGKVVILNFWATWCAPCVTEFPSMVRMVARLKGKVQLVTVSADERKEDVLAFIKTFKGMGPHIVHLWDPSTQIAKSFGTQKLPETYILKPDLKLAKKVVSSVQWDKSEVLRYLEDLSAKSARAH